MLTKNKKGTTKLNLKFKLITIPINNGKYINWLFKSANKKLPNISNIR